LVIVVLEADSFLYHMARIMVAALLAVGRGELEPQGVGRIREAGDRARIGPAAPPHGLCLVRVTY
jgi:tRNA pseudouridine38-40 synthase